MNSLWTGDIPSLNHQNDYNILNKDLKSNHTTINSSGCPSRIHFGNTSYTLGFGHLFSGNLQCHQSFNPIRQCYESCSFEVPEYNYNPMNNNIQTSTIQLKSDPRMNDKVDEAIENIRKTMKNIEKQYNYSIPSVPTRCNPIMNNSNQNNIAKAAALLERAANAMSTAAHTQSPFRVNN